MRNCNMKYHFADEFVEIISKTTLHQNIPFPLENSDFVKLYFGSPENR